MLKVNNHSADIQGHKAHLWSKPFAFSLNYNLRSLHAAQSVPLFPLKTQNQLFGIFENRKMPDFQTVAIKRLIPINVKRLWSSWHVMWCRRAMPKLAHYKTKSSPNFCASCKSVFHLKIKLAYKLAKDRNR